MFRDHNGIRTQNRLSPQKLQGVPISEIITVGGVKKDQIQKNVLPYQSLQQRQCAGLFDRCLRMKREPVQVPQQSVERRFGVFRKVDVARASTERLNPYRTGTRKQVGENRTLDAWSEHIEKRLPQPVAGGPRFPSFRGHQRLGTKFSRNNAHCSSWPFRHRTAGFLPSSMVSFACHSIYNTGEAFMRSWSIPMGRLMGVEIRLHFFFALLLGLSLLDTGMSGMAAVRGIALWLLLLATVSAREVARAIASTYHGLQVRSLMLLPIGGLPSYATPESAEQSSEGSAQMSIALVGPIANFVVALLLLAFIFGVSPTVSVLPKPWISADHLLRSAFWLNIFLAVINLLPAYPLDAGKLLRGSFSRSRGALQGTRTASSVGQIIALVLFVAGVFLQSPWLLLAGFFIFVGAQLEDQGMVFQSVVDTVRMRDIMLTDFALLSSSDTLEDAVFKSIHSLQDDFPVVRSGLLVGVVSRQRIVETLQMDGNGYIQSIMNRAFQVAQQEDSLGVTFRRITGGCGLSLVPVLDGERIVGIVTLQNLMHSMGLLAESRRLQQQSSS